MIISIDEKKATDEQIKYIRNLHCLRCKQKLLPTSKRVVFVELSSGEILAWHGLKNIQDGGYECDVVFDFKERTHTDKPERTCQICKRKYRSVNRIRFCGRECEKKYFTKYFHVVK